MVIRPYFQIQMNNIILMHMLQALTDLSHVFNRFGFGHLVIGISNAIEQFATGDEFGDHGHFHVFFECIVQMK